MKRKLQWKKQSLTLKDTDEETAMEALSLIKVDYQVLPAVFDAEEAYKPEAPQIHDHAERNVCFPVSLNYDDVEKGFNESDIVVELEVVFQHLLLPG